MKIRLFSISIISTSRILLFNLKSLFLLFTRLQILLTLKNFGNHGKCLTGLIFLCAVIVFGNSPLSAQTVLTTINLGPESGNGLEPHSVAVNPNTNMVYVAIPSSNTVNVIDDSNNQVVDRIIVGQRPEDITVNPNTNMVYVTIPSSNTVTVIDGSNNQVVDAIRLRRSNINGISGIAVNSATNMVYVASRIVTSLGIPIVDDVIPLTMPNAPITIRTIPAIFVIDGTNNRVVDTIRLRRNNINGISGIAVNSATNMVYVTSHIVVIIELLIYPPISTFVPIGTILFVIDGTNNRVVDTIIIVNVSAGIAVNPNTNMVYVTIPSSNTVNVIDGTNNQVVSTVIVGDNPSDVATNKSSNLVYVANSNSGDVTVIQDDGAVGPIPTSLTVEPATAKESLRLQQAAVNVLQDSQRMSDVVVSAFTTEPFAIVKPSSAKTDVNGIAKFRFRFRIGSANGKITFTAGGLSETITQN